eukprot:c19147_g1_i1 orf=919-1143(+)
MQTNTHSMPSQEDQQSIRCCMHLSLMRKHPAAMKTGSFTGITGFSSPYHDGWLGEYSLSLTLQPGVMGSVGLYT